jgi:hypothetical protein
MAQPTDSTHDDMAATAVPGRFQAECVCGSRLVVDGDTADDDTTITEWLDDHDYCRPVDLDDAPDPALAVWEALTELPDFIEHDGDASKVIPFPRPAWSDPDEDVVGVLLGETWYRSKPAKVLTTHMRGHADPDCAILYPAYARVSLRQFGTRPVPVVTVTFNDQRQSGPGPGARALDFAPADARLLAHVLLAAAELAEAVH